MPGAFTAGVERPAKICTRARMVTTSGAPRCSTSSTVNFLLHTGAKPFQPIYTVRTAPRTGSPTCPSASFSSISSWSASKPRLSVRGHAHQTVADIAGNIPAVEHQHVIRRQRTACIKCQRVQHYPAPVIPVNLVAILPALPISDSACLPISP